MEIRAPTIPYIEAILIEFHSRDEIHIQCVVHATSKFSISIQCSTEISFYTSIDVEHNNALINCFQDDTWGTAQIIPFIPIIIGNPFEIVIKCDPTFYKFIVDDQEYVQFPHRPSFNRLAYLVIDGDVLINKIIYYNIIMMPDVTAPSAPFQTPPASGTNIETPPPSYDEVFGKSNQNPPDLEVSYLGVPSFPASSEYTPTISQNEFRSVPQESVPLQYGILNSPNAASPNFQPVQPSYIKKILKWIGFSVLIIAIIILASKLGGKKRN